MKIHAVYSTYRLKNVVTAFAGFDLWEMNNHCSNQISLCADPYFPPS